MKLVNEEPLTNPKEVMKEVKEYPKKMWQLESTQKNGRLTPYYINRLNVNELNTQVSRQRLSVEIFKNAINKS